jgi:hypothetical protein
MPETFSAGPKQRLAASGFQDVNCTPEQLRSFCKAQDGNAITERLNGVYSRMPAQVNPALGRAQLNSLQKNVW